MVFSFFDFHSFGGRFPVWFNVSIGWTSNYCRNWSKNVYCMCVDGLFPFISSLLKSSKLQIYLKYPSTAQAPNPGSQPHEHETRAESLCGILLISDMWVGTIQMISMVPAPLKYQEKICKYVPWVYFHRSVTVVRQATSKSLSWGPSEENTQLNCFAFWEPLFTLVDEMDGSEKLSSKCVNICRSRFVALKRPANTSPSVLVVTRTEHKPSKMSDSFWKAGANYTRIFYTPQRHRHKAIL